MKMFLSKFTLFLFVTSLFSCYPLFQNHSLQLNATPESTDLQTLISISDLQEYAEKNGLPDLIIFDIDNTLIESARQIALDPSTNGFLRKQFPRNSEEIIRSIQSHVPWKLCENNTAEVIRFFQQKRVNMVAVTKRSAEIKESVFQQLLENGIDFRSSSLIFSTACTEQGGLKVEGGFYENGILYAQSDKGTVLKNLLLAADWHWKDRLIYFVDDRKSHLEDYRKTFQAEITTKAFEYTYSHNQNVDESILKLQLEDFLSGRPIKEDTAYVEKDKITALK